MKIVSDDDSIHLNKSTSLNGKIETPKIIKNEIILK